MGQEKMITIEDIAKAIAAAPDNKKVEVAHEMLDKYKGSDKNLIAPDILSHAYLYQTSPK